jgi:hypothetical protein
LVISFHADSSYANSWSRSCKEDIRRCIGRFVDGTEEEEEEWS